ncbi:hypothetical protein [Vibrio sp. D431a]|uniref:hypothetical protein n=1 Tax=Vibrio sp. D431a TaxID=2837388 RepID=UPI002553BEDE|nr:hypothetical protein [Vibrio sp. D431a]MDK9790608.1 hypothetical protein [Vibrio sp. D431a]
MIKPDIHFLKSQFNKLLWPDATFVTQTGAWCAFIIMVLGTSLVYLFDPIAIKLVMFLSGS